LQQLREKDDANFKLMSEVYNTAPATVSKFTTKTMLLMCCVFSKQLLK